jgi:integrase
MATVYKRDDSPCWQILTRKGTRRTSEVPHTTGDPEQDKLNKEKAQDYADTVEGQEWQVRKLGDHSAIPFADAVKEYRRLHAHEPEWGRRDREILAWLVDEPAPNAPQLGARSIREVADWDALIQLQAFCDAHGWQPKTTNRTMAVVSAVLHCNPKWFPTRVRIPLHKIKQRERPYIPAERIPDVCQHLPYHGALAVNFAVVTLLRMSAMLSMRWSDIYPSQRWAVVRTEKQKTNRPFGFALTDAHLAILEGLKRFQAEQWQEYARVGVRTGRGARTGAKVQAHRAKRLASWDHEHVFTWYGQQIKDCNTASFHRAVELAQCPPGFNWHSWRHVGATLARLAGISLPDLQALGGWDSIASVQRYAHIVPQSLMPAAQKLAAMLPGLDAINDMRRYNTTGALVRVGVDIAPPGKGGGAGGDRTRDLILAKDALSHLSYGPTQITHAELSYRVDSDPEIASLVNQLANKLSGESAALRTPGKADSQTTRAKRNNELRKALNPPSGTQRPKKAAGGA